MKNLASIMVMVSTFGIANLAQAEGPDPHAIKRIYETSRSAAGLIHYCVEKGFLTSDSSDNAQKMVAYADGLPVAFDKSGGDEMEKYGREGKIKSANGKLSSLDTDAPQGLEAWCKSADEGMRRGLKNIGQ